MEARQLVTLLLLYAVLVPPTGAALPSPSPSSDVSADVVRLDVEDIHTLPPGDPRTANVTVELCAPAGGLAEGPRRIEVVAAGAPEWLTFTVEPATFTFTVVLPGECDTARGVARFNATPDAPAFEVIRLQMRAQDAGGGGARDAFEYAFRVGYHGALSVEPEHARVDAPLNTPVTHRVHVTNHGNAETTFRLNLAGAREDARVVVPQPLVLAPGATGTWHVTFVLPDGSGLGERSVDLLVTSHARLDHNAPGESTVVTVEFSPRPGPTSSLPIPGPGVLGLIGVAAAAVAAGVRARRP